VVDVLDMLQCPDCGTFYKPETTPTGRTIPHCQMPDRSHRISLGQRVEAAVIEVDLSAVEARMVEWLRLTEDVVDPPLTGQLLDIEV